jgi:hypothetical protein
MVLVPRPPDSVSPLVGAAVVIGLIARVEKVQYGQLSGTRVAASLPLPS